MIFFRPSTTTAARILHSLPLALAGAGVDGGALGGAEVGDEGRAVALALVVPGAGGGRGVGRLDALRELRDVAEAEEGAEVLEGRRVGLRQGLEGEVIADGEGRRREGVELGREGARAEDEDRDLRRAAAWAGKG